MTARYALVSDTGLLREANEDNARVVPELGLYVIADGMGGHVAGEVASQVAVDALVAAVADLPMPRRIRDQKQILRTAILTTNEVVFREAQSRELYGMGTTLTALRVTSRTVTVAHVGDTRAYFVRPRKLDPITRDHTMVALLVSAGAISPDAAGAHPEKHLLTQAIGTQPAVEPDVIQLRIPREARILLSTDGLHDHVPADEILEIASAPDLEQAVHDLVQAANARGGPDNITLILIEP